MKRSNQNRKSTTNKGQHLNSISGKHPAICHYDIDKKLISGLKIETLTLIGSELIINGWAINDSAFQLFCDGKLLETNFLRKIRHDVASAFGMPSDLKYGFYLRLLNSPHGVYTFNWQYYNNSKLAKEEFILDISEDSTAVVLRPDGQSNIKYSKPELNNEKPIGNIEHIDKFTVKGWTINEDSNCLTYYVNEQQQGFALQALRVMRQDVSDTLNVDLSRYGFEFIVPGSVWEGLNNNEEVTITIRVDGQPLRGIEIKISQTLVAAWIKDIFLLPDTRDAQFLKFVAIEHLYFGNFFGIFDKITQNSIRHFVNLYKLNDYLPSLNSPLEKNKLETNFDDLYLWQILRSFNSRLNGRETPEEFVSLFRKEIMYLDLSVKQLKSLLLSLTPQLCSISRIDVVLDYIDTSEFLENSFSKNVWNQTTALPFLIERSEINKAADIIYSFTENLDNGWFSTECIRYAVCKTNQMAKYGSIDLNTSIKLSYSVIYFLDKISKDWFSRLTDDNLIAAFVDLVRSANCQPEYFRKDLFLAAIRIYGLLPRFWQLIISSPEPILLDSVLLKAKAFCELLNADKTEILNHEILVAIRFFLKYNNEHAKLILREKVLASIAVDSVPDQVLEEAITILLEDPAEGVRLAAHPAVKDAILLHYDETSVLLNETIRNMSGHLRSDFLRIQKIIGKQVINLKIMLACNDSSGIEKCLIDLNQLLVTVDGRKSEFLSIDLRAWIITSFIEFGIDKKFVLSFVQHFKRSILEFKSDQYPSVSLFSALARFSAFEDGNTTLGLVSNILHKDMTEHFGNRFTSATHFPSQDLLVDKTCLHSDTLVVLYSCRKYLGNRADTIRKGWIQDLKVRDIPYLILVGDGDDAVHGDVLELNVSDRYEDLPKKTLKLIDWVLTNTNFQRLYKIDDDCFLDVNRFFDQLSYRKHHYYGRVIHRAIGSMDRCWHQEKSHSPYARRAIDKSPEPSVYADGGGGYLLSRLAMTLVQEAARTDSGQLLVLTSLMEDKLVGDLLSLSGIKPTDEDYGSYQRRRTFAQAVPVGAWENIFFPSRSTPTVMSHLDSESDQVRAFAASTGLALLPKRIFLTSSSPKIGLNSNQLELLSSAGRLQSILSSSGPLVVAVMRNELTMLPHFLEHYRKLGFAGFLIVDNLSDDGTREALLGEHDVALFSADTEYKFSHYGVAWQHALLGNFCLGRWVLLADADELLVLPGSEDRSISDFIAKLAPDNADAIRIGMVDMYPQGDLAEANLQKTPPFAAAPWFDQPPLTPWRLGCGYYSNALNFTSAFRHRIDPLAEPNAFNSVKTAFIKYNSNMRFSQGLHDASGVQLAKSFAWFAHFKYHAGFKEKVEQEIKRGQHFNGAQEYRRYKAMLAEVKGSFVTDGVSMRYTDQKDFNQDTTGIIEGLS